jgi:hypothetical protein
MPASTVVLLLLATSQGFANEGLTLRRFNNTAFGGPGLTSTSISSLEDISDCESNCGMPSSLLITGRLAPPVAGKYGFAVVFDPPLPYPSPEAYARLWVHDHLLFPSDTCRQKKSGTKAPKWIPLPPRALDASGNPVEHPAAANLSSYEVRFEYVCLAQAGCNKRKVSLLWKDFAAHTPVPPTPFTPIPSSVMIPTQSVPEVAKRALATKLQSGWGTFYSSSMFSWVLLPESFAVRVGE